MSNFLGERANKLSEDAQTDLIERIKGYNKIPEPEKKETEEEQESESELESELWSLGSQSTPSSFSTRSVSSVGTEMSYDKDDTESDDKLEPTSDTGNHFDAAKRYAQYLRQLYLKHEYYPESTVVKPQLTARSDDSQIDSSKPVFPPSPPPDTTSQKPRLSDGTKHQLIQIILNRHKKLYLGSLLQNSHTLATSTLNGLNIPPNNTIEPVLRTTTGLTSGLLKGLRPQENTIEPVLRITTGLTSGLLKGLGPQENNIEPVLQTTTELASGLLEGLKPQENTIEPVIRLALTKANDVLGELQKQSNPSGSSVAAPVAAPVAAHGPALGPAPGPAPGPASTTTTASKPSSNTNTLGDLILNGEAFRMAADGKSMNPVPK